MWGRRQSWPNCFAIFLVAVSFILPRICLGPAMAFAGSHVAAMEHTDCAQHGSQEQDGSGHHSCCLDCTCCAAPAFNAPFLLAFKVQLEPVAPAMHRAASPQRVVLARITIPINVHGPPVFS
jgi:hypothetical protein